MIKSWSIFNFSWSGGVDNTRWKQVQWWLSWVETGLKGLFVRARFGGKLTLVGWIISVFIWLFLSHLISRLSGTKLCKYGVFEIFFVAKWKTGFSNIIRQTHSRVPRAPVKGIWLGITSLIYDKSKHFQLLLVIWYNLIYYLTSTQLHYRPTFDLDNKNKISWKNLSKVVKFQNLVEKCCNVWKIYIALLSLQIFSLLCYVWKLLPFLSQNW